MLDKKLEVLDYFKHHNIAHRVKEFKGNTK